MRLDLNPFLGASVDGFRIETVKAGDVIEDSGSGQRAIVTEDSCLVHPHCRVMFLTAAQQSKLFAAVEVHNRTTIDIKAERR